MQELIEYMTFAFIGTVVGILIEFVLCVNLYDF